MSRVGRLLSVVKVGGSLLDWPGLPARLQGLLPTWQYDEPGREARCLLVVGGGPFVDAVRRLDQIHDLSDRRAHWLAIDALGVTAELVSALVHGGAVFREGDFRTWNWALSSIPILSPGPFLRTLEARYSAPLPATWDLTSDSIAAIAATELRAEQLVLLKSAPLAADASRDEAAERGLVDSMFPAFSRDIEFVRYLCLREEGALMRNLRR